MRYRDIIASNTAKRMPGTMNRTSGSVGIHYLKETKMLKRMPATGRLSVPPSRAGPSRRMCFAGGVLMLSLATSAKGQEAKAQGTPLIAAAPQRADSAKTSHRGRSVYRSRGRAPEVVRRSRGQRLRFQRLRVQRQPSQRRRDELSRLRLQRQLIQSRRRRAGGSDRRIEAE